MLLFHNIKNKILLIVVIDANIIEDNYKKSQNIL